MTLLRASRDCSSALRAHKHNSPGLGCRTPTRTIRNVGCNSNSIEEAATDTTRRTALLQPLILQLATMAAPAFAEEGIVDTQGDTKLEAVASGFQEVEAKALSQVEFKELEDSILAYRYKYPVETTEGVKLSMVLTRAPEKYSSAAPLTPDARQRIVSELFDLRRYVTATVTVGPTSGVLKTKPLEEWKPEEVAYTVLIDRSTSRLASGERVALNEVEEAHLEDRNGTPYWVYEHVAQGSPTIANLNRDTYRHALAVTTLRPGLSGEPYLYSLNLSCPQELWPSLEPLFKVAVSSFTLVPTTRDYIPPDQNPWLFF